MSSKTNYMLRISTFKLHTYESFSLFENTVSQSTLAIVSFSANVLDAYIRFLSSSINLDFIGWSQNSIFYFVRIWDWDKNEMKWKWKDIYFD